MPSLHECCNGQFISSQNAPTEKKARRLVAGYIVRRLMSSLKYAFNNPE